MGLGDISMVPSSSISNEDVYLLMNADVKVLRFKRIKLLTESFEIIEKFDSKFPCNVLSNASLGLWLKNRVAPFSRKHIKDLLKLCGLNDVKDIISATYMLSLNDAFWVKHINDNVTFSQVNLYDNSFDDTISRYAFSGNYNGKKFSSSKFRTPELTTDGMLAKRWRRTDNGIVLLKAGTPIVEGYEARGNEPWSEYFISQLSEALGFNHTKYSLAEVDDRIVSVCDLFCTKDIGLIKAGEVNEVGDFTGVINLYEQHGLIKYLYEIIVLDAITFNTDRHLNNLGLLVDNTTQDIICSAPIYDNGFGLLAYVKFNTLEEALQAYKEDSPVLYDYFEDMAVEVIKLDSTLRKALINTKGFKLTNHSKYPMEENRFNILNEVVQYKINELLSMS